MKIHNSKLSSTYVDKLTHKVGTMAVYKRKASSGKKYYQAHMATSRRPLCCAHRYWKQWWSRSLSACCSKRVLLLLVWVILFNLSHYQLLTSAVVKNLASSTFITATEFVSSLLAPFIGWLADVKFGRYETIKLGSLLSMTASIFFYFALFTGGVSTLSKRLLVVSFMNVGIGTSCFSAALLPFLTDQLIGATADELSTLVCLGI